MSQLFRLKNGTVLLSTEAPGGIYNSSQLKKIAELCSKELAIVKATEDQRLALFVKESEVARIAKELRAMGLGFRHYQDSLHQPVSCLGELCEEHEQPAMATAMDITKEIASIQLTAPLKIGINGCARCCTPCHTLDIAVVGDASGYRISLGGKTRQMPEFASYFAEGVPPKELPRRLKSVIETFKNFAEEGETLHDVIERCGVTDFVQALAPYSQDAAHREDPFAKEAAAAESLDDLAVPADEAESLDDMDTEASLGTGEPELDLEAQLEVEDDFGIADDALDDGALDEIPIERTGQGSLEDDLSLGSEDADLELNDLSFEEETPADLADEDLLMEESLVETSDNLLDDDAGLDISDSSLDELNVEVSDDDLLNDGKLEVDSTEDMTELSFDGDEASTTSELDENMTLDADDTSLETMEFVNDDKDIDGVSSVMEDDIDLDAADLDVKDGVLETQADADLDESMLLEDDVSDDLIDEIDDPALAAVEVPLDEDLEGIPELDEDLGPEDFAPPSAKVPASPKAPAVSTKTAPKVPALTALQDDFGEELPGDMTEFSDEEESQFEQKLHASIDEESRLLSKADKDPNVDDREAALSLLENSDALEDEAESIELDDATLDQPMDVDDELTLDDELEEISSDDELETISEDEPTLASEDAEKTDEVLEPIQETLEEFPEPGPSELAHIKSRQPGQKPQGSAPRQQFKVNGITFQDGGMRVSFESGAYVDFDLSALSLGEKRNFLLGVQNVSVTSTREGYMLEFDGMRLFHPKTSFPAAS